MLYEVITSVAKLSDLHASQFRRDTLGFIFQSFGLFEELSVADNVSTPLIHSGLSPQTLQERIDEAMKLARIDHKAGRSVRLLSGGEKQRCAIARALVNHPRITSYNVCYTKLLRMNQPCMLKGVEDRVVRGDDNGFSHGMKLQEGLQKRFAIGGIKIGGRFIAEDHLGVVHECRNNFV